MEIYTGHITCCNLVSHNEYVCAVYYIKVRKKMGQTNRSNKKVKCISSGIDDKIILHCGGVAMVLLA